MKRAESSGVIPQEQHSGISANMSIEVAVIVVLLFEYIRQTRRNAALGSYDAENFYDCVTHNFFSLTCLDFDMPLPTIILILK